MTRSLEGAVAIVTGGSQGIGRACAQLYAREGAKVVIANQNVQRGEEAAAYIRSDGGEALFVPTDVSQADQVEDLVRRTVNTFGRLDIGCNNSAIQGDECLTHECTEDNWDRVIDVNLKVVWLCMKFEIIHMLGVGKGVIINMGSVDSVVGWPLIPPYVASKHGIAGLTRAAALEYAAQGIRINAVGPGVITTPMNESRLRDPGDIARMLAYEPIGRFGTAEEVAELVVWLSSDAASFVHGALLMVDGGFTTK